MNDLVGLGIFAILVGFFWLLLSERSPRCQLGFHDWKETEASANFQYMWFRTDRCERCGKHSRPMNPMH